MSGVIERNDDGTYPAQEAQAYGAETEQLLRDIGNRLEQQQEDIRELKLILDKEARPETEGSDDPEPV